MSHRYDFRLEVKNSLMRKLYQEQLDYWNRRLMKLCRKNAMSHGRRLDMKYAVYFKRKQYRPHFLDWTDRDESKYCLPLHPAFPDLAAELEIVAEEMDELEEECYEADRFLSGLVLFKAPPKIFEKVLGETLYQRCRQDFEMYYSQFSPDSWDRNGEFSMNIFVEKNQGIIKAMNERLLINLVTLP